MANKNRQLFDMEACIKEKKLSKETFRPRDFSLKSTIRVSGAPELSRFRTRVVLNDTLSGASLDSAVKKALSLKSKQ